MPRTVVATHDPPPKGIPNPIHDDAGATASGYAGALVAGVRTYGWCSAEIVADVGDGWLDDGWVDYSLHRPAFVGDEIVIGAADGVIEATTSNGLVLSGTYGRGEALFAADLDPPSVAAGEEPPEVRPQPTLDDIPVGRPLRPLEVRVSSDAAGRLATDDLGVPLDGWSRRIHPYFLAARMAPLTRHNFTYGPTIHVRSQIQHVGPAIYPTDGSDQFLTVGARIVDAYERKAHWYQVLDGVVSMAAVRGATEAARVVARIRHHTIFSPRGTR